MDLASQKKGKTSFKENLTLYRRLLSYVMRYRWIFILGVFFVVIFSLTTPGVAILMKPLLDGSFVDRNPTYIFWTPMLLIFLFAIRGLASYANSLCFSWLTSTVVFNIQRDMIEQFIHLPTRFYDTNSTSQIISRITSDVNSLMQAATTALITMIRESITIIGLLTWIFILDWILSLIIVISTPLILLLVRAVAKRLRLLHRVAMHQNAVFLRHLQEATGNHRLVKLYQTASYEMTRLRGIANELRRLKFKQSVADGLTVPLAEFVSTVAIAVTVYFTLTRDLTDPLTVGGFVSFMAALALITSAMKRLLRINNMLQTGLTASERVFFLLDQEKEIETGDKAIDPDGVKGNVSFQNIFFHYPNNLKRSLDNVTLEIKAQNTVALVGASGSGKTTLTSLIPRLYEIENGQLEIDGVNVKDYKLSDIRNLISFVSQDIFMFDDTISANIAYGNIASATKESIYHAAKSAYALEFIEKLPEGFDTIVGEKGVRLSGGQKQRIAIARAFIKDAPILIFDEATSALDTHSEFQVRKALKDLGEGRTVIIIAHRLSSIEHVDRIIVMSEGQIVEDGTHEDLMDLRGHYYDLYTVYQESDKSIAVKVLENPSP